ncbi:glycosyltransferase family 4 protein [Rhizobium sp. SG570]|uniref:glycosyltransferase family 4 protein n=1 Tax=Rhizobium sp. SG570 TaxID=2587113 RepID=UPI001447DC9D|nr:glycosyltransferase family 4 protein [Rhizobium sp. SG570]NKJ40323.1 glycosyltransferase involved in cell wall biosynthesis [Rhizobium sp. SG570]
MKLLFVSRSTPFHQLGGMEIVSWALAKTLVSHGHDVGFLTTDIRGVGRKTLVDGIKLQTLDCASGRYSKAWWQKSQAIFLNTYANSVDLVMGIGGGAHGILDARIRTKCRTPVVLQSHGTPWGEIVSKLSVRSPISWAGAVRNVPYLLRDWRLGYYSGIVSIGPAVDAALRRQPMSKLVRNTPITMIENGVREAEFSFDPAARSHFRQRLGIGPATAVVISLSRLILQKGVRESLLGFARLALKRPDIAYLMAGEGNAEPMLRAMARDLNISDKVHFLGPVSRGDLSMVLSAADVFLFTSLRQEGLAIAPLEAAASGLPAILSSHLKLPEIVAKYVPPTDPDAVADALKTTLDGLRIRNASLLPKRYSLEHATTRYLQFFEQAI